MTNCKGSRHSSTVAIHQLIEKNALLNPIAGALSYNGITISYKELNERSNQLAHFLQSMGVMTETFVGISVDRSIEMIIGVLAILKAGGTYLPIDPNYPKERINYMLFDSKLSILVTQRSLATKFSSFSAKQVLLDSDQEKINDFPVTTPGTSITAENLAYVLYTSGSTGNPKGVMVRHKSLIHAYNGWKIAYKLTSGDCHLQMANFSFDVFTGDFIRALGSGAKLVLCPRVSLLEPEQLYRLMEIENVNCAEFVPTVLRRLIEYVEHKNKPLDFMRLMICGSDNWSINEYRNLQQLCGNHTRVINSYGLTEATIDSTYFEDPLSTRENFTLDHTVPLGKPFPDTEVFLLDGNQDRVAHGEIGEIYVGGDGLAKGYLNRPDLTNLKFIKHPFNNEAGARLYRTGDQGRYLPDGNIECLGRIDTQVKLRGMRIELSDIENVLNCYEAIRESLVMVSEDQAKYKRLIAYIVKEEGAELNITTVRKFLHERLPIYMIPAFFIKLNCLPLTPNGKLDRQALNNHTLLLSEKDYIAPRNPIESQLVMIWEKLFGLEKIGVHDDFTHDLGGDSIIFANLISQIEEVFFLKMMPCNLPSTLTIESLAELINTKLNLPETHVQA